MCGYRYAMTHVEIRAKNGTQFFPSTCGSLGMNSGQALRLGSVFTY